VIDMIMKQVRSALQTGAFIAMPGKKTNEAAGSPKLSAPCGSML
jgi:hypothetical protein